MELKKYLTLFFMFCSISFSLSANQWLNIGKDILSCNNEPQVRYWLNFIENNTKEDFKYNDFGQKIYKLQDYVIIENGNNDNGRFSKGNVCSHSYKILAQDDIALSICISEDEIQLSLGKNNKNIYWILLNKQNTEYKYFNYENSIILD